MLQSVAVIWNEWLRSEYFCGFRGIFDFVVFEKVALNMGGKIKKYGMLHRLCLEKYINKKR